MNRWLSLALKLGITAALFWLLLRKIDINAAWQAIRTLSPWAFVACVALLVVQLFICGLRWQMVVKALGAHIGTLKATALFAIGTFFGLVLPGAVGGDAVRMWATRRAGLPLAASINSVVLERVMTVFALVLLVVIFEPMLATEMPHTASLWLFPAILVAMVIGTIVVMLLDRLPERIQHWRAVQALAQLAGDTRKLCLKPTRIGSVLIVALIGHLNLGLAAFALARGMNVDISLVDAVVLFMPAVLVATLPISVSGWGAREAAMVTLYGFAGVQPAQALAISILYGLASTLVALPGGLLWLADRKPPPENPGGLPPTEAENA